MKKIIKYEEAVLEVQKNYKNLIYVQSDLKTYELCMMACKQNGLALGYVPKKILTDELIKVAVQQDGNAIDYVPNRFFSTELYILALDSGYNFENFECRKIYRNYNFIDFKKIYLKAIEKNGDYIKKMDPSNFTFEILRLSCQYNGNNLKYVLDEDSCKLILRDKTPKIRKKTYEICMIACKQTGLALKFVPEKMKTFELCSIAVKQNNEAIEYVPEELKGPELYL